MKRILLITSVLLVLSLSLAAQQREEKIKYLQTKGKIDLGFSGLGLSLETPISQKLLLEVAAGVGAGYRIDEDFRYRMYFNDPSAFGSLHIKYYYNLQNRVDKGRPISYNAGNFFGIKAKYASPTLHKQQTWHTLLTSFHWGMQRKMGKYFVYQFNIGVGAAIDLEDKNSNNVTLFPDVNFRISYVLPF